MNRSIIVSICALIVTSIVLTTTSTAITSRAKFVNKSDDTPLLFQAAGPSAAAIQSSVDAFRTQLGTLNPNVVGSFGSGRREINWDAVPDIFSAPNNLPANFFNVNSPRGVIFSTTGSGFQVSAKNGNPTGTPINFGNLNSSYPTIFRTFSAERLFTALDSNTMVVHFFVPGSNTAAITNAFGAVFTDVDLPADEARCGRAHHTQIEYLDANGRSLFKTTVPASTGDRGLSFVGAFFSDKQIATVRIVSGSSPLGPNENKCVDVVAMDDFIYGEPVAP